MEKVNEGKVYDIDKDVTDQVTLEVGTEFTDDKIQDKASFEEFKVTYQGQITDKCIEEYGSAEDKKLWEDIAKEMYLEKQNYVPTEDMKSSGELEDKLNESLSIVEEKLTENKEVYNNLLKEGISKDDFIKKESFDIASDYNLDTETANKVCESIFDKICESTLDRLEEKIETGNSVFELKFDCSNEDVFGTGYSMATPLANVLTGVATKVADLKFDGPIMDRNGNKIGSYGIGYEGVESGLTEATNAEIEKVKQDSIKRGLYTERLSFYDKIKIGDKLKDDRGHEITITDITLQGNEKLSVTLYCHIKGPDEEFDTTFVGDNILNLFNTEDVTKVTENIEKGLYNESRPDKEYARNKMFSDSRRKLKFPEESFTTKEQVLQYLEKCEDETDVMNVNNHISDDTLRNFMLDLGFSFNDKMKKYPSNAPEEFVKFMVDGMKKYTPSNDESLEENKKLQEHTESWLINTNPENHRVKPFVDYFKKEYPNKKIDKLWLEAIEGGWEPCVAFIESGDTVYRVFIGELNGGTYLSNSDSIKIVGNDFKKDYDYYQESKKVQESQISDYTLEEIGKVLKDKGNDFKLQISGSESKTNWLNIDKDDLEYLYKAFNHKSSKTESKDKKEEVRKNSDNGITTYNWTDRDVEFIKSLLGDTITVRIEDEGRSHGNSIELKLATTDYIDSGIVNFTDAFYHDVEQWVKSEQVDAELAMNNTGSIIWLRPKTDQGGDRPSSKMI